jgi:hypothetical protein
MMLTGQTGGIDMYRFFVIIVWALAVCGLGPQTAKACETTDKVIMGVWPGQLGLTQIFAAENMVLAGGLSPAARHCLDIEMVTLTDISQFDIALQQGVPEGVFISTDTTSFVVNRSRILEIGSGEKAVVVGHLNNASYGVYARKGKSLGEGSRLATSRCGWQDRELTTPLSPAEATEALSIPTLVMLPWLRAEGHRIWCGMTPPPDFKGVQLIPVGNASKRDAAFLDVQNKIDFMVFTIERATARTVGENPELELVVGPEKLRRIPEALLIARESCLSEDVCADVVRRTVAAIKEVRQAMLSGREAMTSETIRRYAASDGNKASIKGADNEAVTTILARYLISHELPQTGISHDDLLEMIEENGWQGVTPEELVDPRIAVFD